MDCETEISRLTLWKRLKPKLEITVLCVVIGVSWGLLSVPVVIYHLPNWEQASVQGEENCSVLAQTVATCSPTETYEGQTCGQYLSAFQNCLDFGVDDIYIAPQSDQSSVEIQATAVVGSGLQLVNPSPECEEVIRPFICLYLFRLCDGDGRVYEPSCGSCVSIRDDICVREWTEANQLLQTMPFGFRSLPACEKLPDLLGQCNGPNATGSNDTPRVSGSSSNETEARVRNCSTIQCQEGFYCTVYDTLNISICRPRCDTWEQLPHFSIVASDVAVIFSSLVGMIAGIILIVMSVIQWRRMFRFPSVFVVYIAITGIIFALFILISYVDRPGLYCSSLDLEESVQNPTPFCTTAGVVIHYVLLQITLWWFIHLTAFIWKVMFPFHAKSCEERHLKYAHIAGVLIALLVPVVPVVVTATNGGFTVTRFPPIMCTSSTSAPAFYSLIMLIVVFMQFGITLLLIILWKIHKQQGLSRGMHSLTVSKQAFKISTAEKKLLLVFFYYILLGVVALTAFTLTTKNVENHNKQLILYFQCEAHGVDPNNPCDTTIFDTLKYIDLVDGAAYVLLGLLPAVSLIYVIDVKELKQTSCCTTCLRDFRIKISALLPSLLSSSPPEKEQSSTA